MTKGPASVELTGGAGFDFEDRVAAFFAAAMLAGISPFGADLGGVRRLDRQVGRPGWLLDDLLIALDRPRGGSLSLSIKRDRQVTEGGFPAGFVEAVWRQWRTPAGPFQLERDLLGLVVGKLAESTREAWDALLGQALAGGDAAELAARFAAAGASSRVARSLFRSLHCPAGLCGPSGGDPAETAELLRRIRLIHPDLISPTSADEGRAIGWCQLALRSGDPAEARALWEQLIGVCAARRAGGGLDLPGLYDALRGLFHLKDRPDYEADWRALEVRSRDLAGRTSNLVAGTITVPRAELIGTLAAKLKDDPCLVLVGESGAGKSAALRSATEAAGIGRVLWLTGDALEHDSVDGLRRHLGLVHSFEELIASTPAPRAALVLDGLDRLSDRAAGVARALVQIIRSSPAQGAWCVAATVGAEGLPAVIGELRKAGVPPANLEPLPLPPLTPPEVTLVLDEVPGLRPLLDRPEMWRILGNLKILDWVATAVRDGAGGTEGLIGYTQVVGWVWEHWTKRGAAGLGRSAVLKSLATAEAESLSAGVGLRHFGAGELPAVAELQADGLIRVTDERAWFTHDLLGDLGRYRTLVEDAADGGAAVDQRARLPRWHHAIRLYGQRLLEGDESLQQEWQRLVEIPATEPGAAAAQDALLEAAFLIPWAGTTLETLWPMLTAGGGRLLRRLLHRFRYAATIPDPRLRITAPPERVAEFAAYIRYPWWPYWPAALEVLAAHAQQVAQLASIEVAPLCSLWLRSVPTGFAARGEAARLAIAAARELQGARGEDVRYSDGQEQAIFESLIYAAAELPEEGCPLCLELCRRRPEPPEVGRRAKAHRQEVQEFMRARAAQLTPEQRRALRTQSLGSPEPLREYGPMREQFTDGPASRVDTGFQSAVLNTHGLLALAAARPEVAREVLLACCLREPEPVPLGRGPSLHRFGAESPRDWLPPLYFRGPFLNLLTYHPELGTDCIIRLVDQVSLNWEAEGLQWARGRETIVTRVRVRTSAGESEWIGGGQPYAWFRNTWIDSRLVISALMALERWLYDLDESGGDVEGTVAHILTSMRSVAILGVLISVGKRLPRLLGGPLLPVLSQWCVFLWDRDLVRYHDQLWRMEMSQWERCGETSFNMARDWHDQPHRSMALEDVVLNLVLDDAEFAAKFQPLRDAWAAEAEAGGHAELCPLQVLMARLDPANYITQPDTTSGDKRHFRWPEPLRTRVESEQNIAATSQTVEALPRSFREALDNAQPLTPEQAARVWALVQALASLTADQFDAELLEPRRQDAILGGVAALGVLARSWLEDHPERAKWCGAALEAACATLRTSATPDRGPSHATEDGWPAFVADAVIDDLARENSRVPARRRAAEIVCGHSPTATRAALRAAFRRREELESDFGRLVNLAVAWSALRATQNPFDPLASELTRLRVRRERLVGSFIRQTLPADRLPLPRVGALASKSRERCWERRRAREAGPVVWSRKAGKRTRREGPRRERRGRDHPGFDLEILQAAFSWLGPLSSTRQPDDRREVLSTLRALVAAVVSWIPDDLDERDDLDDTPWGFETWVLDQAALAAAEATDQEHPEALWEPILTLHPAAHIRLGHFLRAWLVYGPRAASTLDVFFARWRRMIEFAQDSPVWNPGPDATHHCLDELWEELLGVRDPNDIVTAASNEPHLTAMSDLYCLWAARWLHRGWGVRNLCHFLQQPGTKGLAASGLVWVQQAVGRLSRYELARDGLSDDIAAVLRRVWTDTPRQVQTPGEPREAFLSLLTQAAGLGSAAAIELRNQVARGAHG